MAIKVADTFIAVAADMSAYNKSLKEDGLKSAQSLGSQIKAAFRDAGSFGGTSKAAGFIADLKLGRSLTASLKDATAGLGSSLKGLSVGALHAGLNGVKTLLGGIKTVFGEIGKGFAIGIGISSVQSLGRVLSDVVGAIPSLVQKGQEYLRMVDDIADATGAGSVETSKFTATLLYLGVPLGGVINMIGQASRNLELMGPRLERLGIEVKDSSGAWLNQIQILDNARHAMSQWGAGSKKVDILAREFGRGGLKTLVDFLNLTDEQFKRITDDAAAMGMIVTEEQRNMAEASVREGARFQNVWTGLGAALFTAVGPSIMAFFSNLTDTIVANMDAIKLAMSQAINFVIGAVTSLLGMTTTMGSFSESIEAANAVTSPYSGKIIDLTDQIGKLDKGTQSATDSGAKQRKAIQGQISAIEKQITALEKLEKQQDKTYTKAIEALQAQLDVQNDLLDAEEKALDQAERDAQLTEDLRQAKIKLFEAQAQLRADTLAGADQGTLDQGTLDIAAAQRDVLDAQKAITDEAAQRGRDDRRAQLEDVKTFIDDIQQALAESDNKTKTLADLRKQLSSLEGAQPDLEGTAAADNLLKIEALKTTILRAQQQIRNDDQRAALERQKAHLQEEVSNVSSASRAVTNVKKKELEKQLAALIKQEEAWSKLTDEEKAAMAGVAAGVSPGLVDALNEARDAGVEFGEAPRRVRQVRRVTRSRPRVPCGYRRVVRGLQASRLVGRSWDRQQKSAVHRLAAQAQAQAHIDSARAHAHGSSRNLRAARSSRAHSLGRPPRGRWLA